MSHSFAHKKTHVPHRDPKDRVQFIEHKGKQVLLIDSSHCTSKQLIENYTLVQRIITAQPPNSVLTLSDFTGARVDRAALTRMKEVAVVDKPHVRRAAMVGVDEQKEQHRKAIMTFSTREFPSFATREEALDWLVSE